MNEEIYDDIAIEREARELFGVSFEVKKVIAREFPLSRTMKGTLFLSDKKQLYFYVHGQSKLLLADVKKLVSRAGLKAELYLPPKGRPNYFDEIGREKFREVFPGRTLASISEHDIAYYRTLAPYSPALLLVQEVKDGTVYQFDTDSLHDWRPHVKFAYRRIRTS